jgi:histidinol-phosphate aminotransferase
MSDHPWQEHLKTSVRNAPPRGRTSVAGYAHRLQWNENPFDFPEDLKEEVLRRFSTVAWSRYPTELRPEALLEAIAVHNGVDKTMVAAGAGSSAMINAALDVVIAPGNHMVIPSPTFLLYRGAAMLRGAELHQIPTRAADEFALPVDDLIVCARTNEAKLIALCAPNNPTGTVYALDDLRSLADESAALLLIDEAYGEFCGQDLRPLLTEFENVVILRTFSKAYALAGQRIGYALGHPDVIAAIDRVNIPFPVSTFSAMAAMVALENSERFLATTAAIVAERDRLSQALGALPGLHVFPSGANFLLVQFDRSPKAIMETLRDECDLLVSDMAGYPELTNCLRISIGTPEENAWVLDAVTAFSLSR